MNSEQIETFLAIAETRSIAHASENLFLSQPTVSYRLQSLERELGFTLFKRKQGLRNVELTDKGHAFVPLALSWMHLWQNIRMLSTGIEKLSLTLSCSTNINKHLIMPYKRTLTGNKDIFDLTVRAGTTADTILAVKDGSADMGFVFDLQADPDIQAEPLFLERMVLIKPFNNANELRTAYHSDELNPENEVCLLTSEFFKEWHKDRFGKSVHPYAMIKSEAILKEYLKDNRFWSIVPASTASIFQNDPSVKVYELLDPPKPRTCYRIINPNLSSDQRRSIQTFSDSLKDFVHTKGLDTLV